MQLIRLMRMGLEALQPGEPEVRRDDAEELSAIREGGLSFDGLLAMVSALQQAMQQARTVSKLPTDIDHAWVDALFAELLGMS